MSVDKNENTFLGHLIKYNERLKNIKPDLEEIEALTKTLLDERINTSGSSTIKEIMEDVEKRLKSILDYEGGIPSKRFDTYAEYTPDDIKEILLSISENINDIKFEININDILDFTSEVLKDLDKKDFFEGETKAELEGAINNLRKLIDNFDVAIPSNEFDEFALLYDKKTAKILLGISLNIGSIEIKTKGHGDSSIEPGSHVSEPVASVATDRGKSDSISSAASAESLSEGVWGNKIKTMSVDLVPTI